MTEYIVEEIVGKKIENGTEFYYVKWKGFTEDENTWEPRSHFIDTTLIEKYENKINKNKIKKEKKTEKKNFERSSDSEDNNYLNLKRNKNSKKKEEKNKIEDNKTIKKEKKDKNDKKEIKESEKKENIKKKKYKEDNNIKEGKLGINKIKKIKHCYFNDENEKNPFFTVKFKTEGNQNFKDGIFEFEELVKKEPELIARYLIKKTSFSEKRKKILND